MRARWTWPFYRGVVGQYREAVAKNARHLFVFGDGHFEIDHIDEANPDQGALLGHFLQDTLDADTAKAAARSVAQWLLLHLGLAEAGSDEK